MDAELDHWHLQPFGILLSELVKARRTTQGAPSQVHALFGTVPTNISIIEYGELLAPWFHDASQQNRPKPSSALQRHRHLCLSFDSVPMIQLYLRIIAAFTKRSLLTFWLTPKPMLQPLICFVGNLIPNTCTSLLLPKTSRWAVFPKPSVCCRHPLSLPKSRRLLAPSLVSHTSLAATRSTRTCFALS